MPAIDKASMKEHQPAVALGDAAAWFVALEKKEGLAAKALVFLSLTAARSGEIRLATWDEINFDDLVWVVPAERMKMRREHRVPLTEPAMALLISLPRMAGTNLIFPSSRSAPFSDATLSAVMKRMHADELINSQKGWLDPVLKRPAVPHGLIPSGAKADSGGDSQRAESLNLWRQVSGGHGHGYSDRIAGGF